MKKERLGELIANAISHGIGVLLSIVALIVLIVSADETSAYIGVTIFSICLIIMYMASTLYHAFPRSMKRVVAVFKRLDHSAIYLLIAGTYTPFILLLHPTFEGYTLLAILWIIAVSGVVMKSIWIDKFQLYHLLMYVAMGWSIVFIWPSVRPVIPDEALWFLMIGGISYTSGILFYVSRFYYAHFIWHMFVIGGSSFHFISIYHLI